VAKILIIEDDVTLGGMLSERLRDRGHDAVHALDGAQGLQRALADSPDLVILDLMLPGVDGWEICRRLREKSDAPVLMLTARTDPQDVVRGLELGADDYVRKPFDLAELESRVMALLRRADGDFGIEPSQVYDDGVLRIDSERRIVTRYGQSVRLTPTEFRLLAFLAANAGRTLSQAELVREVWGPQYIDDASVVTVYIRYLREKLEDAPSNPEYIRTEWGLGYRFVARRPEASRG
jgi:DNA-binding response OmpR family regulator